MTFTDAYGRVVTQNEDGSWTAGGITVSGLADEAAALFAFNGMAPESYVPPPPPKPTTISARAFIARFSPEAQQALFSSADWKVQMFRALATAGDIDLTDPTLAADLGYCVALGLIPEADVAGILTP